MLNKGMPPAHAIEVLRLCNRQPSRRAVPYRPAATTGPHFPFNSWFGYRERYANVTKSCTEWATEWVQKRSKRPCARR